MFAPYVAPFVILAVGLIWKFSHGYDRSVRITWVELAIAGLVASGVTIYPVVKVIDDMSTAVTISHDEWRGGLQSIADRDVNRCYAGRSGDSESDGETNCRFARVTGHYWWTYRWTTQDCKPPDKDGKQDCTTIHHSEERRAEIWTPWADREATYSITSWFGKDSDDKPVYDTYHFDRVYVPEDAKPYGNWQIPASVRRGPPKEWAEAAAHIKSGDYLPAAKQFTYPNPVISAKRMGVSSNDYAPYVGKSFGGHPALVDHTESILANPSYGVGEWETKKVQFACMARPANDAAWQSSMMQVDAVTGLVLQGDVHLVFIDEHCATNAESVARAYKAWWVSDRFDKKSIAKNAIIIVAIVHTDASGMVIAQAAADTGMPYGNGPMSRRLQDLLRGQPVDPASILGHPMLTIEDKGDLPVPRLKDTSAGIIPSVVLTPGPFQFVRYCMRTCSHGQPGGYWHLVDKIRPSAGVQVLMLVLIGLLSCLFWWWVTATSFIEEMTDAVIAWTNRSGSIIPIGQLASQASRATRRAASLAAEKLRRSQ